MNQLVLDATALTAAGLGDAGPDDQAIADMADPARRALEAILARRAEVGSFELPDDRRCARTCMDFARGVDPAIDTVVVLGIGGSSLPGRALYQALAPAYDLLAPRSAGMPRRLVFADNIDPVTFGVLLERMPVERTLWLAISKSGTTAETCAQLLIVLERGGRVACVTDPAGGAIRAIAASRGLPAFDIPPAVGGRFSTLTPVGLLPAALAGLDVAGILDGARRMRDRVVTPDLATNPALLLAALLHHHHVVRGRSSHVLVSYVDGLAGVVDLAGQLWAEALGKAKAGPTPIGARGATDHHSQLQLWAEGPDDKVYLTLGVADRGRELAIPHATHPELAYLGGHGLGQLLDATQLATTSSLVRRGRPVGKLTLARCSAEAIGELVMLLEVASVVGGPLYGVDPFGEPGVEDGKRLAFAALGRPGYEALAVELSKAPSPDRRYVV